LPRAGRWRCRASAAATRSRWPPSVWSLLAVVFVAGVAIGSVPVAPAETLAIVARRLFGLDIPVTWQPSTEAIIWELRIPRVLTAMVVGVGLSVAGATFQGLLRNPLADPYVSGHGLGRGAGSRHRRRPPDRTRRPPVRPRECPRLRGALGAVLVVYRLSRTGGMAPMTSLLLTGYAVGSLLAAGLGARDVRVGRRAAPDRLVLLGSFDASTWARLAGAAPLILIGSALVLYRARSLNGLLLGEETASHLGVDVKRERRILLALGSLLTAAAVAVSGLIGLSAWSYRTSVRLVVGPNARLVIPLSAIYGAALLATADIIARTLGEIPVGVVTALIGAPVLSLHPPSDAHGLRAMSRAFELQAVSAGYPGRDVLKSIDLAVAEGERLLLLVPTVPASPLCCARSPASCTPLPAGPCWATCRWRRCRERQSPGASPSCPQLATLPFAARVDDVVALGRLPHEDRLRGLRERDRAAVAAAIDMVGLGKLVDRDARTLSLGERQLVLLALAIAQKAPVIILDEPTVHLDIRHQVDVMELLRELNVRDGTTIVAVMHDLRLAAHYFPRTLVLADGRLVMDRSARSGTRPRRHSPCIRRRPGAAGDAVGASGGALTGRRNQASHSDVPERQCNR
jgi:iron complex transport system permease protein